MKWAMIALLALLLAGCSGEVSMVDAETVVAEPVADRAPPRRDTAEIVNGIYERREWEHDGYLDEDAHVRDAALAMTWDRAEPATRDAACLAWRVDRDAALDRFVAGAGHDGDATFRGAAGAFFDDVCSS